MRKLTFALLALVLAACGEDAPSPNDLRLIKVSGDGQRAPVLLTGARSVTRDLGRHTVALADQDEFLPALLVAQLEVEGGASGTLVGPSAVVVPAGTEVEWRAATPDGGTPLNSTTLPDDSGRVDNKWRKPTRAGQYEMLAEYIAGDSVVSSVVYSATFDPGPPSIPVCTGLGTSISDTLDFSIDGFEDANGNVAAWVFEPFASSALYTVTADSQAVVMATNGSGIDSVRIVSNGDAVRTSHVYVRHPDPQVADSIMVYHWSDDRDCGDGDPPTP